MMQRVGTIDRREVLRYLRVDGDVPADLAADLDRCEKELLETARPRTVWRLLDYLPDGSISGTALKLEGRDICAFLQGCDQVILLGATLGMETESLIRRAQSRSMADAVILDAVGSAAIETVCDDLCRDLEIRFAPRYLTDRFSPGYGDLPLERQRELGRVLDLTRRIGVSLTPGGVMVPQKSVTAILGVSDTPKPRRVRGCDVCENRENCQYRKKGQACGKP